MTGVCLCLGMIARDELLADYWRISRRRRLLWPTLAALSQTRAAMYRDNLGGRTSAAGVWARHCSPLLAGPLLMPLGMRASMLATDGDGGAP